MIYKKVLLLQTYCTSETYTALYLAGDANDQTVICSPCWKASETLPNPLLAEETKIASGPELRSRLVPDILLNAATLL